jgi:hypothetical protein
MLSLMIRDSLNPDEIPALSETGRQSEDQSALEEDRGESDPWGGSDSTATLSQRDREPNSPSETDESESLSARVRPCVREYLNWHRLKKASENEMSVEEMYRRDAMKFE